MRAPLFLSLTPWIVVASCGGTAATRAPTREVDIEPPALPSSSNAPSVEPPRSNPIAAPIKASSACGLTFFTSDYDPRCQRALDAHCCAPEKACARDSDCVKLVACLNACPAPKTDACVGACAVPEPPPGLDKLDAIAECSKRGPPDGLNCDWPVGGGH